MKELLVNKYIKKQPLNVLVFPGGTENGLEIMRSLAPCKEFKVFSIANDSINHAPFVYKNHDVICSIYSEKLLSELNEVIERRSIDIIFPANSLVIDQLLKIRNKLTCEVLLPQNDIIELTRSKRKTISALEEIVEVPKVYNINDITIEKLPVFVKPDKGYGSQGARCINNLLELGEYKEKENDFIFQEYLVGHEYSVDCFSSDAGELLFASGRKRERIRMGTSMHAEPLQQELEESIHEIAVRIASRLKIPGLWFFQLKADKNNKLKLLEVDIRVAGTMCYNRARGVNFPKLAIFQHIGMSVGILINKKNNIILDRSLANRYILQMEFDHVYVDLDDCLIIHDSLNYQLVSFLYQSIGKGKKIHLISKCLLNNKEEYLKKYRILQLFDEIIWLKEEDKKWEYITHKNSIFIDDSFSQRSEVADILGISTFDPSMIECLLDERI